MLNRRLQRLVLVYTCQNTTLLDITCCGLFLFQRAGGKLKNLLNRSSVKKTLDKNYELKYSSKNSGKVFTWENVFKVKVYWENVFKVKVFTWKVCSR